jgi:hypothetical protein
MVRSHAIGSKSCLRVYIQIDGSAFHIPKAMAAYQEWPADGLK